MTQQPSDDPFAPKESRPSVSFKSAPLGTSFHLKVTSLPVMVQARDFDTRELEFWPDGGKKLTVATNVVDLDTGEEKCLWAPKPSSMFAAIQAAQQAAGAPIALDGTLTVTFTHEVPVEGKPHLNPAKQYAVQYAPPNPFVSQHPAPSQAPAAAPPAQQAPPTWAQAPAPQAPPVQQIAPPPAAPPAPTYTPEVIAALLAANIDPRTVHPTYAGEYGWHTV
jgi:hypothetical protein